MIKENPIYNPHTKKQHIKRKYYIKYEIHIKYTIKQKLYNMGITRGFL